MIDAVAEERPNEVSPAFHVVSADFGLTDVQGLFLTPNTAVHPELPVPFCIGGKRLGGGDVLGIDWIGANLVLYLAGMYRRRRPITRGGQPTGKAHEKGDAGTGISCQKWIE